MGKELKGEGRTVGKARQGPPCQCLAGMPGPTQGLVGPESSCLEKGMALGPGLWSWELGMQPGASAWPGR